MDNLTHSFIGATLGQAGLKRLSGLAMPTLIIAANIPDIDAACTVYGLESLGMRRGLTHGPLALLLLPLMLTGIMIWYDRWQERRGKRPESRAPVRPLHLLLAAYIGALSHPAGDWLNSYGIRLLEPFSSRWFYGDSIFIIDLVLWALLIGGFIWSRRAEKRGRDWQRRGGIMVVVISAYIFANGVITHVARAQGDAYVRQTYGITPELVVASPVPIAFWQREILWRGQGQYGSHNVNLAAGILPMILAPEAQEPRPITPFASGLDDPRVRAAQANDPAARAFLFWSRMPIVVAEADGSYTLTDQRFANGMSKGRFSVPIAGE